MSQVCLSVFHCGVLNLLCMTCRMMSQQECVVLALRMSVIVYVMHATRITYV